VSAPVPADLLLRVPQYQLSGDIKRDALLTGLNALTQHHIAHCAPYARMCAAMFAPTTSRAARIEDVPYVPVPLYKSHLLQSISDDDISTILHSSGTTGQSPSRIVLDRTTAGRQRSALACIMGTLLGSKRLPMLIFDTAAIVRGRGALTARGAGVLGMMIFGGAHTFALDDDLRPRSDAIRAFLDRHGNAPFLIFGFTWLVWQSLAEAVAPHTFNLANGILVHSGGWKRLIDRAVDNDVFKARLLHDTGLARSHNFYGMVEQVGGVFLEADDGLLYPPDFANVLIRDPHTLRVVPHGTEGIIQVLSLLPTSYPGHSILTEDRGVVVRENLTGAGPRGKGFRVLGRVPRAELRGCSDVIASLAA
jgi:hypothetical protein